MPASICCCCSAAAVTVNEGIGTNRLKARPYTARRPLRHSRRCGHSEGPPKVSLGASGARSLIRRCGCVGEYGDAAGPEGLRQQGVGAGRIGGGHPFPAVKEVEGAAEVFGDEVDLTLLKGGRDSLARPDREHHLDRIAALGERLPVQLGEDLALDEVERGDPDGGASRVLGLHRAAAAPAAAADGDDDDEEKGDKRRRSRRPRACWRLHDCSLLCSTLGGYPQAGWMCLAAPPGWRSHAIVTSRVTEPGPARRGWCRRSLGPAARTRRWHVRRPARSDR